MSYDYGGSNYDGFWEDYDEDSCSNCFDEDWSDEDDWEDDAFSDEEDW